MSDSSGVLGLLERGFMRHMHTRVWMSAAMALLVICLAGCPLPGSLEELYGYNTIVLRNEGSRPLLAFYIID